MDLIAWFLAGLGVGVLTGLAPGIHINVVASILVSMVASIGGVGFEKTTAFLMAAATAHVFFDFLPSIFLGIRSDDSMLDLPTHRLVKSGFGIRSIFFSVIGTLVAFIVGGILLGVFSLGGSWNLPKVLEGFLRQRSIFPGVTIKALVLTILCVFVVASAGVRWRAALVVFSISGIFGLVMLRYGDTLVYEGMFGGGETGFNFLFAALTGMFGLGFVVETILGKVARIPRQAAVDEMDRGEFLGAVKASSFGVWGGIVTGVLPGLGSANAAALMETVKAPLKKLMATSEGDRRTRDEGFIALTGAIQAADMFFAALVGYFVIGGVMRSGIAAAFGELRVPYDAGVNVVVPVIACMSSALICAGLLFLFAGPIVNGFVRLAEILDLRTISAGVFGFILGLLLLFTGWMGLFVCCVGFAIWLVTVRLKVRFSLMMGFFLVPVTVYSWLPGGSRKFPWLMKGWNGSGEGALNVMSLTDLVMNLFWAGGVGVVCAVLVFSWLNVGRRNVR